MFLLLLNLIFVQVSVFEASEKFEMLKFHFLTDFFYILSFLGVTLDNRLMLGLLSLDAVYST